MVARRTAGAVLLAACLLLASPVAFAKKSVKGPMPPPAAEPWRHKAGARRMQGSGIGSFASGVGTFASGVGTFASGVGTFASGVGTFASGVGTFASGVGTFASGVGTFASGVGTFASGSVGSNSGYTFYPPGTFSGVPVDVVDLSGESTTVVQDTCAAAEPNTFIYDGKFVTTVCKQNNAGGCLAADYTLPDGAEYWIVGAASGSSSAMGVAPGDCA